LNYEIKKVVRTISLEF